MNKNLIIIATLHLFAIIHQSVAATLDQIQACESQSYFFLFVYEQCVNCYQNCSLCNGIIGPFNACMLPTAESCNTPGFMFNEQNECQDCRIEEKCIKNCDGYWQTTLKTCLRIKNRSYQIKGGISCLDANENTCTMCRDQKFQWSKTLRKCLRCPSFSTWNSTTMTCSQLSTCDISLGIGFDSTSNCSSCSSQNLKLNKYSIACESCPSYCQCQGMYAQCDVGSCSGNYIQVIDGDQMYCECKGTNYHNGTVCLACPSNCLKCMSDGKCIKCADGFLIDKSTATCVDCSVPNSIDPLYCEIQAFAYCLQRTVDQKYCNLCQPDLVYDYSSRYCVCTDNKVYNPFTQQCFKCSDKFPYCKECNATQCYTCLDSSYNLATDQQSCQCTGGFVKKSTCVPCITVLPYCAICNSTGTICTSCLSNYGLLTSNGSCYECNTINTYCVSCNGTNKCTACTNGYTLNDAKTSCDCDVSASLRAVFNNSCYLCSNAISNCQKCDQNTAGTELQCSQCVPPYVVIYGTCKLCAAGSYRQDNTCQLCSDQLCALCSSQTNCFACNNGYDVVSQRQCKCNSPKIIMSKNLCSTCTEIYSPLCTSCNSSQCTACSGTNYNPASNCQCQKGINYPELKKCLLCPTNCATCTTVDNVNTTCISCDPDYKLQANNVCTACGQAKYYDLNTKSCKSCNSNCSACADNQNGGMCTACYTGYQLNPDTGTCNCTGNYVYNEIGTSCILCSARFPNCSSCDTNGCFSCVINFYLQASTKTCIQCTIGSYFKAGNVNDCIPCPEKCTSCAPITGYCIGVCTSNYDLNAITGLCQCATTKILIGNGSCQKCSLLIINCTECSSITTCTKCSDTNKVLADGSCTPCPTKKYYNSQTNACLQCGERCNGCIDETGLCSLSCSDNYRIESGICVCSKDRSLDYKNICQQCSSLFENCIECNSSACTKCNSPFALISEGKCISCTNSEIYLSASQECKLCKKFIKNCKSCLSTTICTNCLTSSPFELSQLGDSCSCPKGFYLIPGEESKITDDACVPCSSFDPLCLECKAVNLCSLCINKYVLIQTGEDKNKKECKSCQDVVDPNCDLCNDHSMCIKCFDNYRWDDSNMSCIPDIILEIYSETNDSSYALSDNFNMILKIPDYFINTNLFTKIYLFDTHIQYESEVQLLKSKGISEQDIPFNFKNCIQFISDDLSVLPNPLYIPDTSAKILRRSDQFLLHEGDLIFVHTVESQNQQFKRFSHSYNIKVKRNYNNMKDLVFNVGKVVKKLSSFSLYQQNEICQSNEQCYNKGRCIPQDKLCKCVGDFKLFDCSDYITINYDLVIEQISKQLIVNIPQTYQEKFVSMNLPLLVTQSTAFSLAGINANFRTIQNIIKGTIIYNNERDDIDNLMSNIMNNVSRSIKEINTNFAPNEIIQTIKQLQSLTEQLLFAYNNKVSFSTTEMQLLASIERDPSRINTTVDINKIFNLTSDPINSLFTPSDNPQGSKAKILRYSFLENPHKVSTHQFQSQPRTYPLVIVKTYQQTRRILQSSEIDTYQFEQKNFTFKFDVENPSSLKNLICLTLLDLSSDQYTICENILISESSVQCNCQNSATIYEDIHYNYLPKQFLSKGFRKNVPISMIITIVVLSVLIAFLIFIQIKNKKKQMEKEKVAQTENLGAVESVTKRKLDGLESVQNRFLKRGSQEEGINTVQDNNKTQQYEQVFPTSPVNVKDIRLNLFENSPKSSVQQQDFILHDNFELETKK